VVLLIEPERTPFDLNWRMFDIPVRVSPWFWLVSALMGWSAIQLGIQYVLLWIACVFVSVLVHELGHVLVGRMFGSDGRILLYGFGGLAIGSSDLPSRWQRIAVYLAGPLAGFLFLGVIIQVVLVVNPERLRPVVETIKSWFGLPFDPMVAVLPFLEPTLAQEAISNLFWINLFWGLLNLVPIWPLDGGQISRELFVAASPRQGLRWSLGLSALTAALLAVQALAATYGHSPLPVPSGVYSALFFGLLAVSSFQAMQSLTVRRSASWGGDDRREPWQQDPDYWKR
jgi:stage IV sporulation protein FB